MPNKIQSRSGPVHFISPDIGYSASSLLTVREEDIPSSTNLLHSLSWFLRRRSPYVHFGVNSFLFDIEIESQHVFRKQTDLFNSLDLSCNSIINLEENADPEMCVEYVFRSTCPSF